MTKSCRLQILVIVSIATLAVPLALVPQQPARPATMENISAGPLATIVTIIARLVLELQLPVQAVKVAGIWSVRLVIQLVLLLCTARCQMGLLIVIRLAQISMSFGMGRVVAPARIRMIVGLMRLLEAQKVHF